MCYLHRRTYGGYSIMLFVIGGAYQGKLDYVKERFELKDEDIFTCTKDGQPDLSKRCIYHYENFVWYGMKNEVSVPTEFGQDKIIIMDDINCGVVPIDPEIRAWREAVGRAGSAISRFADEVVRVYCGLSKTLKSKTTKIYLIRHGKTMANIERLYCGQTDLPITDVGRNELEEKKTRIDYPDASKLKCYTSGLTRTQQTFKTLFGDLEFTPYGEFNEMDFGDFEMRKYDGDLESDPDYIIWTGGNNETNVCPHGESNLMMKRRSVRKFKEILSRGEDAVIVAHGGPIISIYQEYIPYSGLNNYDIQPKNGEGFLLEFEGGSLISWKRITEQ